MLQTKDILTYKHLGDPCAQYITDKEYVEHMIPHHQVAIDMSFEVMKHTVDPNILFLASKIIRGQTDEILFMEGFLLGGLPNMGSMDKQQYQYIPTDLEVWYPKEARAMQYQCGLHHFDTNVAKHHIIHANKPFTDKEFLEHMISHHDVAVEMSKRLIKHSKNTDLVAFAYKIILNQEEEIWLMKLQLKHGMPVCSSLFV
jgi:uncharacterized protein (DUF305 family)